MLKFSFSSRWASVAIVSNTMDDLPDPDTPVKMVIFRFGMLKDMFFRLFSRAPRISMNSWGMAFDIRDSKCKDFSPIKKEKAKKTSSEENLARNSGAKIQGAR